MREEITRETLLCIRCGACLNVCPVYNNVGGHAYGFAYSGPIGAMLSPQLLGSRIAADLPFASSLCGACVDICPVKIPIVEILLRLRRRVVEGDAVEPVSAPPALRIGAETMARTLSIPWLYEFGAQALRIVQAPLRRADWLPNLPPPLNRWTMTRPLPAFGASFRGWWRSRAPEGRQRQRQIRFGIGALAVGAVAFVAWLSTRKRSR